MAPTLPIELERIVFEIAADTNRANIPSLIRVSQRARIWLEPLLYTTLRLDHRSTRLNSAAIYAISLRPPEFLGKHIRHVLLVAGVQTLRPSILVQFLEKCENLENFVIVGDLTGRWLLQPLGQTGRGIKRLGIDVGELFVNNKEGELERELEDSGLSDEKSSGSDSPNEERPELLFEEEEYQESDDEQQPARRRRQPGFILDTDSDLESDSDGEQHVSVVEPNPANESLVVNLKHSLFRSVTHLDLLDTFDPEDEELADIPWVHHLNLLPSLTHLSLNSMVHPLPLYLIIQSCPRLEVLMVLLHHSDSWRSYGRELRRHCPDPRVIVVCYNDAYDEWEDSARGRGRDDIWVKAERLIVRRRSEWPSKQNVLLYEH